jgi:hypothetical protein
LPVVEVAKSASRRTRLLVPGIDNKDWFGAIEYSNGTYKRTLEMRSLNLDQLRTLIAISRLGSFSAAGRELNLTQPAISLQTRSISGRAPRRRERSHR